MQGFKPTLPPCFVFLALLSACTFELKANQEPGNPKEYFEIQSDKTMFDWVLDPKSGRVFGSILDGDEVIEVDLAGESVVRRIPVGNKPERMLIKNGKLVVLCQDTKNVAIIDLDTNQVEARLNISCENLCDVSATRNPDNNVFVFAAHSRQFGDVVIYKINTNEHKVIQSFRQAKGSGDYLVHGVVSDGGTAIGFDRRGYVSPSGADLAVFDTEKNEYRKIHDTHDSFEVMQAGPADRYWLLGPSLVSFRNLKPVRKFSGQVVTVHRSLNLAASLDVPARRLDIFNFSNAKRIKSITLDQLDTQIKTSTRRKTWQYNRDVDDPFLCFDDKNKAVFVGLRKSAILIPLSEFFEERKPLVLIKSPGIQELQTGTRFQQKLELTDKQLTQEVSFELESGPDRTELKGNELTWSPGIQDIGEHKIVITAKTGGVSDRLVIDVSVQGNEIDLGVLSENWAISPSGKYAIAWGTKADTDRSFRDPRQAPGTQLVVVDLTHGKRITQIESDKPIQGAAIDDQFVYVVNRNSNILNRFQRDDLTIKKRIFLPGAGLRLQATDDRKLLVHYRSGELGLSSMKQAIINPGDLQMDEKDPRAGDLSGATSYPFFDVLESGKATDGRHIYDAKTGKIEGITQVYNTGLKLIDNDALRNFQTHFGSHPTTKRWGRTYDRASLRDGKGNQICQIQYPFVISPDFPLGVQFVASQQRNGRVSTATGQFKFIELIEGTVVHTQKVFESTSRQDSRFFSHSGNPVDLIQVRGKQCHTLYNGKIYSVAIPDSVIAKAKSPLRILHPKNLHVVLSEPSARIKFETPGYSGIRFELTNELRNVEIDESTGELTIDTAKIWKGKLGQVGNPASPFGLIRESRKNAEETNLAKEAARRYGISDDQLAFLIPLAISATGPDGQSDRLQCCLVALGDKKTIDARQELLVQQQKEAQRKREAERAKQMNAIEQARSRPPQKGGEEDMPKRDNQSQQIGELNRKIRRLEAVIDTLLSRMEKMDDKIKQLESEKDKRFP